MLEKMSAFFEARLEGYDAHMLANIESATSFYPFTANMLPTAPGSRILDLGCGTGLELEAYLPLCPTAQITGIDLSEKMLSALKSKFPDKDISLIAGSSKAFSLHRKQLHKHLRAQYSQQKYWRSSATSHHLHGMRTVAV